jgi:hypothetical protein
MTYHDGEKEVCFVHMPSELNYTQEQQERFIGEATSTILAERPPGAPRGYLLTPRRFISLQSLVDAIMEADGVPPEVVAQQRRAIDLISTFAEAMEDEEKFARLVEQHKSELGYEFFALLSAFIDASIQERQDESASLLTQLRDKLATQSGFEGDTGEVSESDREQLIDQLLAASEEEMEEHIAESRHIIDYTFFQALTARIEAQEQAGQHDEAKRLASKREQILHTVERIDREAQAIFEASSSLLQKVMEAPDPRAVLEEHGGEISEAFMLVLSANIESARQAGREDIVSKLAEISEMAIGVIQSRLPPDERLINDLLMTETSEASSALLRQNASLVTTEFVKKLNELADEQAKRGLTENANRLRQFAREAGTILF